MPHQPTDISHCRSPRRQNFPAFGKPEKIIYQTVNTTLAVFLSFVKTGPVISIAGESESKTARSLFSQDLSQKIANKGGLFTLTPRQRHERQSHNARYFDTGDGQLPMKWSLELPMSASVTISIPNWLELLQERYKIENDGNGSTNQADNNYNRKESNL